MLKIKKNELLTIKYQLGRSPDNLLDIIVYCPFEKPAVLLTGPYSEEKGVFPTTYWLSCPYLVKKVARLEDQGLIKEFSEIINDDQEFKKNLMKAHRYYAAERMKLLSAAEQAKLAEKSRAIMDVIRESGVGGIMDKDGIKCLHTHLADFLVNSINPVGKAVWERLSWPTDCHICDFDKVWETISSEK